jgi:hypothetical protein
MAYTESPRPYKREHKLSVVRGEHAARMERQRARRKMDKGGVDRTGKDIAHNKPLAKGGSNKDGYRLQSAAANRSNNGHKPGEKRGPKKKLT